jgi:tetratricopeptide (TPR) repeat protein
MQPVPGVHPPHRLSFLADGSRWFWQFPRQLARSRPWLALLLATGLILAFVAAGGYGYALYEWHAAQRAVKDDRLDDARRHLKVCLAVWPHSVPVHIVASRVDRFQGQFAEAEAHLNYCLKLSGGATEDIQLEFLLMRAQTGEEDQVAAALFSYVNSGHPESQMILETMARAFMHTLRHGPAYSCLTRWIEVEPDSARAYYWRGWVLERMDSSNEAMDDYQKALQLDPNLYPVRIRVAEMILEEQKPLEALPYLEKLYKEYPENPDVLARLGHCRLLQGQNDEARRLLEAAVVKLPDDLPLLHNLAKVEMQDRQFTAAEKWLRQALKVDPSDTDALYILHNTLQNQQRRQEAAAVLDRYNKKKALLKRVNELLLAEAKKPSNDPNLLSEMGSILLQVEREQVGVYWLDKALTLDPDHQATHQILADYYERKGEPEKATQHRRKLTRRDKTR